MLEFSPEDIYQLKFMQVRLTPKSNDENSSEKVFSQTPGKYFAQEWLRALQNVR